MTIDQTKPPIFFFYCNLFFNYQVLKKKWIFDLISYIKMTFKGNNSCLKKRSIRSSVLLICSFSRFQYSFHPINNISFEVVELLTAIIGKIIISSSYSCWNVQILHIYAFMFLSQLTSVSYKAIYGYRCL